MKCSGRILIVIGLISAGTAIAQANAAGNPLVSSQKETAAPQVDLAIAKLNSKIEKNPADAHARMDLARLLEKKGDYAGVIATLKPASDTLARGGLLLLARAYAKQNDTLNEVRTLELCLAKNARDYVVQTALGETYSRTKRTEESIAAFREARQINPRYKPAYDGLLRELEKAGERYEARVLINDMMKQFGPQPSNYTDLCRLYALDSFLEKAIEICRTAIEKDPKVAENHVYLGMSLKDQEDPAKAADVLNQAAKRFPASEMVATSAGELEAERKNFVAAYKLFKQAVAAEPKSGPALIGLANAAFELQKNEEALATYKRACELNRKYAKEFRIAIGKLRARKDTSWERKFDDALGMCM